MDARTAVAAPDMTGAFRQNQAMYWSVCLRLSKNS